MGKIKTWVLDAGHGGKDSGAVFQHGGKLHREKDYVLDIVQRVRRIAQRIPELNIVLTRESDVYLSRPERAAIANRIKADGFISSHLNFSSSGAGGYEAFTSRGRTRADDLASDWYASNKVLFRGMKIRSNWQNNKPVGKEKDFDVLIMTACPALLVEHGFINNLKDLALIVNPMEREKMAQSIINAICRFEGINPYAAPLPVEIPEGGDFALPAPPHASPDCVDLEAIKTAANAAQWQLNKIKNLIS